MHYHLICNVSKFKVIEGGPTLILLAEVGGGQKPIIDLIFKILFICYFCLYHRI